MRAELSPQNIATGFISGITVVYTCTVVSYPRGGKRGERQIENLVSKRKKKKTRVAKLFK